MAKKILVFFMLGFVWLFIFSVPVGKGKNLYEVLHYYVVDTRPVQWLAQKLEGSYEATLNATDNAQNAGNQAWQKGSQHMRQSAEILKAID